jgi:hypothetical protein
MEMRTAVNSKEDELLTSLKLKQQKSKIRDT